MEEQDRQVSAATTACIKRVAAVGNQTHLFSREQITRGEEEEEEEEDPPAGGHWFNLKTMGEDVREPSPPSSWSF
jgi:hypothetical protein